MLLINEEYLGIGIHFFQISTDNDQLKMKANPIITIIKIYVHDSELRKSENRNHVYATGTHPTPEARIMNAEKPTTRSMINFQKIDANYKSKKVKRFTI